MAENNPFPKLNLDEYACNKPQLSLLTAGLKNVPRPILIQTPKPTGNPSTLSLQNPTHSPATQQMFFPGSRVSAGTRNPASRRASGSTNRTLPISTPRPTLFDSSIEYQANGAKPPVYIAGTFNGWARQTMTFRRKHNDAGGLVYEFFFDFKCQVGRHQYKIWVGHLPDGNWTVDYSKSTVINPNNEICNILMVNPKNAPYLSPISPNEPFNPAIHGSEIVPGAPPGWKDKRNNAIGYE